MERTELENKLEELTLEYIEEKDQCGRDHRNKLHAIDVAKDTIRTLNGRVENKPENSDSLCVSKYCLAVTIALAAYALFICFSTNP